MSNIKVCRVLFGKEITADITILDIGIIILLTGGEVTHIGALSAISQDGTMETIQFPEHKDAVVCEKWVKEVYEQVKCPVVVEAGIHYNAASKEQIIEIVRTTDHMLSEVLTWLRIGRPVCFKEALPFEEN